MEFEFKPKRLLTNLTSRELRKLAKHDEVPNKYGLPVYHTKTLSRSAGFTKIIYDPTSKDEELLWKVKNFVSQQDFIEVMVMVGENKNNNFKACYWVTPSFARLSYMMQENFFPFSGGEPEIRVIQIPQWPERRVLVFPNEGLTIILGIDYYGEAKMAVLRMAMHFMRDKRGGLGLHAGSKLYHLNINESLVTKGALIFGLSGTGKTTITCFNHNLKSPEGITILQDDINMFTFSTYAYGTERNFYIKTDNVTQQPDLLQACLSSEAILENVVVTPAGDIDFDDFSISTNGRCIVQRKDIPNTSENIDLSSTDIILFNTRRYDIPPVGRFISPAQCAAFLMLGESTITSADDPSRVGESKRIVAFDPFIIDNPHKNGNIFYNILNRNPHLQGYLLNTGKIGGIEEGIKITPEVTFKIVEEILRGTISWRYDPVIGYELAEEVPGLDISSFDPYNIYGKEKYKYMMESLQKERREYLNKFEKLLPQIKEAI